ncbi:MAG: quinolinate synthase NadA, partial [Clostridia bacterium]|nr:quinolinate synthase NadA [Clostridia bacterium]
IICTEDGVSYALEKNNPDKSFYYVTEDAPCADMKRNTPERILQALKSGEGRVEIDEDTRKKAMRPLERMLELAK